MTISRDDPDSCRHCKSEKIDQDPDVLDTWFSSGLWPFSTLGWPDETPDLDYFYPTTLMETGYDILFFWVARMIMMGLEFTGEVPFHTVYLHGLIRDGNGRKMSKSYGNVIDPLEVMKVFGTDALRFTVLVGSTPGNDINLSIKKVEANRNFANKIWNAGRFVISSLEGIQASPDREPEWTLADSWIWARMQSLIRDVERLFQNYQYGEAGRQIYDFIWGEYADWYLEVAKLQLREGGDRAFYTARTLVQILDQSLRMLHPFTPFVTEELWGHLRKAAAAHSAWMSPNGGWPDALIIASWPEPRLEEEWELEKTASFHLVQEIVRGIRNLRAEKGIKPGKKISATLVSPNQDSMLKVQETVIAHLAQLDLEALEIVDHISAKPEGHIALVVGPVEIFLRLRNIVDEREETARLHNELHETETHINRLEDLLAGPFTERAPGPIVQKEREKLAAYQDKANKLRNQIGS